MDQLLVGVATALAVLIVQGAANAQDTITVDESHQVRDDFMGFGAEWDTCAYDEYGTTDEDWAVVAERIRWTRMPVVRVMMQTKWCYLGEGKFDWDTRDMQLLYRHLDLCQELGITVLLSDWGCERDWVKPPGIGNTDDPKYAEAIGTYLKYLIKGRGYTCIKFFILVNEPNYEVGDFDRWRRGVVNVAAALERHGVADAVRIAGPDESNDMGWFKRAADDARDLIGAYDFHRYANDTNVRTGGLESFVRAHWDYALEKDPEAASKPWIMGEAGMNDFAKHPAGNEKIDTFFYGLFMADYAVQAARAGTSAVCAWMMDDNGHSGFFWGLWDNSEKGLRLRPWFYPWALLSRYVPARAAIYAPPQPSKDWRVMAAKGRSDDGEEGWTVCIVNRGEKAVGAAVRLPGAGLRTFKTYVYAPDHSAVDAKGFPVPVAEAAFDLSDGVPIACPAGSVALMTSLE
ncbi:MAG: hypothetical protein GY851_13960 [bacterium]|nr:hypothetical protein [bacterium]